MPFPLLGFDTDNDTVFLNETVKAYCEAAGIAFTRCRPYRKKDQAFVEQKNGAVVRRMVGRGRLEGLAAASALAELHRDVRLFVFFQPSFKLAGKERDGARVRKRYHDPRTPRQRLLADPRVPAEARDRVAGLHTQLDPAGLLNRIRQAQQRLSEIAAKTPETGPANGDPPDLGAVLAGCRHAWKEGEVRPTGRRPPPKPRGRRRPDPLKGVMVTLRDWFEDDPALSGRQLLERLQVLHLGRYPDGLLRTVQRRTKVWRADLARTLVLGPLADETPRPGDPGYALPVPGIARPHSAIRDRRGLGLGSIAEKAISER